MMDRNLIRGVELRLNRGNLRSSGLKDRLGLVDGFGGEVYEFDGFGGWGVWPLLELGGREELRREGEVRISVE